MSSAENYVTRVEFDEAMGRLENKFDTRLEGLNNKIDLQSQQNQIQFQTMMDILRNMQTSQAGNGAGQKFQESNTTSIEGLGASELPRSDSGVENLDDGASKEIYLDPSLLTEEQPPAKVSSRKESKRKTLSPEDNFRRQREKEAQELATRSEFVGGSVLRTIASEEFKENLFSFKWSSYMAVRRLIDAFYRKHKYAKGVAVTLQAIVSTDMRSVILNDCRHLYHSRPRGSGEKEFDFPYNILEDHHLDDLSFDQFDVLLRWHMKPVDKAQFVSILKANVVIKFPDGFKLGALNINTQFQAYQRFTEDFKRMLTWLSFMNDEVGGFNDRARDPEKGFVPEVDSSKEKGIVQIFKEMLPKSLADYFFAKVKKPPGKGKYWNDAMGFIEAMDEVAFDMNSEFDKYVKPLLNRYSEGAISHDGSKHLKLLSEALLSEEDILDGDPMVILSENEKATFFAAMDAHNSKSKDVHNSKSKVEHLPCIKTIFSGQMQCPERATCRFSHDEALLREKTKSMAKALQKSPYFSALEGTDAAQEFYPDEI